MDEAAAERRVARLIARDFRNYAELDLAVGSKVVALVGENGAGKTNILEAISLFTPGRGLRRAEFSGMARGQGPGGFAVSLTLDGAADGHRLGTGCEPPGHDGRVSRLCRVDGAPAPSPVAFAEHLRVVWLTPDLDALFRGPAPRRRGRAGRRARHAPAARSRCRGGGRPPPRRG